MTTNEGIQFYSGPKGQNYVISHFFANSEELKKDLSLEENSPLPIGATVMVAYGDKPDTEKYNNNYDIDKPHYGNLNSSIFVKALLTKEELEENQQPIIILNNPEKIYMQNWCYVFQTSSLGETGQALNFKDVFNIDTKTGIGGLTEEEAWWTYKSLEGGYVGDNEEATTEVKPITDDDFYNVFQLMVEQNNVLLDYIADSENDDKVIEKVLAMEPGETVLGNFFLYKNDILPTKSEKVYLTVYYIRNNRGEGSLVDSETTVKKLKNLIFLSKVAGYYVSPSEITSINGFKYDSLNRKLLLGDSANQFNTSEIPNDSILIGTGLDTEDTSNNNNGKILIGKYNAPQPGTAFAIGNGTPETPNNLFEIRKNNIDDEYEIYLNGEKIHPIDKELDLMSQTIDNIKKIPLISTYFDSDNNYIDYSTLEDNMVYTKKGNWQYINTDAKDEDGNLVFPKEPEVGIAVKLLRLGGSDSGCYFKKVQWKLINKKDYNEFNWDKTKLYAMGEKDFSEVDKTEETLYIYSSGNAPEGETSFTIPIYASNQYYLILTYITQENTMVSFGQNIDFKELKEYSSENKPKNIKFYETLGVFKKFSEPCYCRKIEDFNSEEDGESNPPEEDPLCHIYNDTPRRVNSDYPCLFRKDNQFYITNDTTDPYIKLENGIAIDGPLPSNVIDSRDIWALIKEVGQTNQLKTEIQKYWLIGDFRACSGYEYDGKPGYNLFYIDKYLNIKDLLQNAKYPIKNTFKKENSVAVIVDYNKDIQYTGAEYNYIDADYSHKGNSHSVNKIPDNANNTFLTLMTFDSKTCIPTRFDSDNFTVRDQEYNKNYEYSYWKDGYYSCVANNGIGVDLRGLSLKPGEKIAEFIEPVYKTTTGNRTKNGNKDLVISVHKYFIPSEYEATGNVIYSNLGEGESQYALFKQYPLKSLYPKNLMNDFKDSWNNGCFALLRSPSSEYGAWVLYSSQEESIKKIPQSYEDVKLLFASDSIYFDERYDYRARFDRILNGPVLFCL